MSTYAIGDVQGCFKELELLIDRIGFDPAHDTLWFVGDLVNRGPGSLETLRLVKSLGDNAITVLGNHELHLLALHCGMRPTGKDPTLDPILRAPDCDELMNWLLQQPLLHREDNFVMVHAGLHCDWSIDKAVELAQEIEHELKKSATNTVADRSGPSSVIPELAKTEAAKTETDTAEAAKLVDRQSLCDSMKSIYGGTEGTWSENAESPNRLRYAVNCFTRMRFCDPNGTPDFSQSGPPGSQPDALVPWFTLQNQSQQQHNLLIGHWAAMGLQIIDNLYALDSGCVWGNSLTAMRLSDRKLYQVDCVTR
jgi:bis(5'-nucleosyl)-tetraphosphatase (symmetrical)